MKDFRKEDLKNIKFENLNKINDGIISAKQFSNLEYNKYCDSVIDIGLDDKDYNLYWVKLLFKNGDIEIDIKVAIKATEINNYRDIEFDSLEEIEQITLSAKEFEELESNKYFLYAEDAGAGIADDSIHHVKVFFKNGDIEISIHIAIREA